MAEIGSRRRCRVRAALGTVLSPPPATAVLTGGIIAMSLVSLDVLGAVAVRGVEEINVLVVVAGQELWWGTEGTALVVGDTEVAVTPPVPPARAVTPVSLTRAIVAVNQAGDVGLGLAVHLGGHRAQLPPIPVAPQKPGGHCVPQTAALTRWCGQNFLSTPLFSFSSIFRWS